MPQQGTKVFIRFTSQSKTPVLHPATVIQAKSNSSFAVQPEDETLAFEVGLELMIYFESAGQFVQQPARVEAVPEEDPETGIELKTLGEWVSAENRQAFRVCTVMSNINATFGGEKGCPLNDVSATGFAVIAPGNFQIGQVIDAVVTYEDKTYTGRVSIQSVREMTNGKTRYGVNCVKDSTSSASLVHGVRDISMAEQRRQLGRMSRGA